jgi:uncharacterized protein YndB with AHSA1/START domain
MIEPKPLDLTVRRVIAATPQRLFDAWTDPARLQAWWGPPGGRCTSAVVDPRPGGRYRINNETPDGQRVAIVGEFIVVDAPHQLVYTWLIEASDGGSEPTESTASTYTATETVTVTFTETPAGTEVVVVHERIATPDARQGHEHGWVACLQRLAEQIDTRLS